MLVLQSRALYRTSIAKVKRQKENGPFSNCPVSPLPFVLAFDEAKGVDQTLFQ
jgi:hypothetical protein